MSYLAQPHSAFVVLLVVRLVVLSVVGCLRVVCRSAQKNHRRAIAEQIDIAIASRGNLRLCFLVFVLGFRFAFRLFSRCKVITNLSSSDARTSFASARALRSLAFCFIEGVCLLRSFLPE